MAEANEFAAVGLFLNHNSGSISSNSDTANIPSLSVKTSTLAYIGFSIQALTAVSANSISLIEGLNS